MLTLVRRNFGLKILALALAVSAWAYFHFSANPQITAHFDQQLSVPITVTGLRAGNVARFNEKEALVTIVAPRNGPAIKPDQVKAVLNLDEKTSGVYNIPIQIIAPPLDIRSFSPASVTLEIAKLEERTVPVAVEYTGDRKSDIVVDAVVVTPRTTTLHGTANDLARVNAVRIAIPFLRDPTTYDAMTKPIATDLRGTEVAGVQVFLSAVRVRVRFVKSTTEKTAQ